VARFSPEPRREAHLAYRPVEITDPAETICRARLLGARLMIVVTLIAVGLALLLLPWSLLLG